ncbi:MAG: hypothetical protein ABI665_14640 [Vicinamibacterales bacterium]
MGQRETHLSDCTIAAFAMCLGLTYSESLVAIAAVAPKVLTAGASWGQLQRAAAVRGCALVVKKTCDVNDVEEGSGILGVEWKNGDAHAVFFKRGLIFDGRTQCVWEADVYLSVQRVKVTTMLVRTK